EIPFALLSAVALLVLISDQQLQSLDSNLITRTEGIVLLLFFAIFLYYIFEVARKDRRNNESPAADAANKQWVKNSLLTTGGLAGIIFGGSLVVNNSIQIALSLGMSETLVGLTIVAVGTSLP